MIPSLERNHMQRNSEHGIHEIDLKQEYSQNRTAEQINGCAPFNLNHVRTRYFFS
jgi:hypothetical protein